MKIGSTDIPHGLFLAPMAGVTDHVFRALCVEYGAECAVTEMISAKAVCYGDRKTEALAALYDDERPAAIQLFGSEPKFLASAARELEKFSPAFFDINMGCPMPKITNNGEGSALMRSPRLCGEIVAAVREAVGVPVTVKIRAGFTEDCKNAVEVARACEAAGAACIFVHGRTRPQLYSGKADLEIIGNVKSAVGVPVVGNGDIFSGEAALAMIKQTGCDGIMLARGCQGAPWLFAEVKAALEGREYIPPSDAEMASVMLRHIDSHVAMHGERALPEMRKHIAWYTKGMRGSAALRREVNAAQTREELSAVVGKLFESENE
jgi:tRNA-dihydrouridine synthase B